MEQKTILVTGSSGFIGTHLIRNLVAQNCTIYALDILPPRETLKGVNYITGDVRDLSQLSIAEPIHCIYNFAAVHTTPGHEDIEYFDTNVSGATEITRFAIRNNVQEIVFTSSISVYGPNEESRSETSPLTPNSAYGYSKAQAEQIHISWLDTSDTHKLTIVRPAVVFGEGEGGNFTRLASVLKKGFFPFPGRTDTIKACIYVKELLAAIEFTRSKSDALQIFNGAFPCKYTIEQIVDNYIELSFPKAKKLCIPHALLMFAAKIIGYFKGFGLGINPERITKLVRSTNIEPAYLEKSGYQFQYDLNSALSDWSDATSGDYQ